MEFFAETPAINWDIPTLQQALSIGQLPRFCRSIDRVLEDRQDSGEIYCLWGQHAIRRELLRHGIRFSLPDCPNALALTITLNQSRITLHCTINTKSHEADFVSSIETFLSDWCSGLEQTSSA